MLKSFYQNKLNPEAGCDEAGRGCLAGPVVAAAVILPIGYHNPILRDSKKLNKIQKDLLEIEIKQNAISWSIGLAEANEVDEINILNASFLAMHRAIKSLKVKPKFLLIDGNKFNTYSTIPHSCIVKGDDLFFSIAAASVLAKTHRDKIMCNLSDDYNFYNWKQNKGYPTLEHRNAVQKYGSSIHHRKSFKGAV